MLITELSITELGDYSQRFPMLAARQCIQNSVLLRMDPARSEQSIFSGFDGVCLVDDRYEPTADHIEQGVLFAATSKDWVDASSGRESILADVGGYALGTFSNTGLTAIPAVGVYRRGDYDQLSKLHWRTRRDLSISRTCTDIFVWR